NMLIDVLDEVGAWAFFVFSINKKFHVAAKFVDLVFDSGENLAVPPMWYGLEIYRHTICQVVDECMTDPTSDPFLRAFLADDINEICECMRNVSVYVTRKVTDWRVREVVRDAFSFALKHPEQFTLLAAKKRKGYQGHTPNIVGFTALFRAIHKFVDA